MLAAQPAPGLGDLHAFAGAALVWLETSLHQVIYLPDPTITMRGIHAPIVSALGGQLSFNSGVLATPTAAVQTGGIWLNVSEDAVNAIRQAPVVTVLS